MNTAERLMAALAKPAKSRAEGYMTRVEEYLPTLADDGARLAFLKNEKEKWLARYSAWTRRVDDGTATADDLKQTAFDYVETISAISDRLTAFEKQS